MTQFMPRRGVAKGGHAVHGFAMPIRKLFFVLLAGLPALAFASLGDTEAECLEKYGPSVNETGGSGVGDKLVFYEKGGFGIGIEFWKGRAACMFYKKTLRTDVFTDEEIEAQLDQNRGASFWQVSQVIGEGRKWARKDGRGVANFLAPQGLLIVMTDEFALQRMRNKVEQSEKSRP